MIDHLKIYVADLPRSRDFYERALAPLGYGVLMEPAPTVVGMGREGKPDFWLQQGEPTVCHAAFAAESTQVVDAFYTAAREAGGLDNGGPGMRPQYHPGYYGAFVFDPDGNNVEAVFHWAGC